MAPTAIPMTRSPLFNLACVGCSARNRVARNRGDTRLGRHGVDSGRLCSRTVCRYAGGTGCCGYTNVDAIDGKSSAGKCICVNDSARCLERTQLSVVAPATENAIVWFACAPT